MSHGCTLSVISFFLFTSSFNRFYIALFSLLLVRNSRFHLKWQNKHTDSVLISFLHLQQYSADEYLQSLALTLTEKTIKIITKIKCEKTLRFLQKSRCFCNIFFALICEPNRKNAHANEIATTTNRKSTRKKSDRASNVVYIQLEQVVKAKAS